MSYTAGYSYCAAHDDYFTNAYERDQHIQASKDHPQCHICDRRFLNLHTLRKHFVIAVGHHYCEECRRHFKTAEGLEYHLDRVHRSSDDSDSDDEDDYPPYYQSVDDDDDDWEDEQGLERYPDGVPPESQAHKRAADDDNSWEAWDDFDFEDEEDLVDPVSQESNGESDDEGEDDEDEENLTHQFVCPMCEKDDCAAIYTTRCGHLFCAPCITAAFKYTHECPICDEPGEVTQLRRLYVAASDE
ncbi:hypothetical protein GYMLUDRAFT_229977 [Collybiopsis luxurians FD-317 M1]|uniref:RING-type domain-containing protein n=1 Tax=Collybiopsis luxurians FD-317 M1 TaxID=944289 RepID=A0A0D0C2Q5_9AGAR|nr:hypothetical protein GYMLUDRAFT_229977 [Collybiopsis luxurians FD-317 M1]